MNSNPPPDVQMERRSFQTSCERCRRRKIKCDRLQPCSKCEKAKSECTFIGSGEKQRPSPRGYVQALKGRITSLEQFITKLASVDSTQRDEMLANFSKTSNHSHIHQPEGAAPAPAEGNGNKAPSVPIRSRAGHLRRLKDGKAAEFYGATSFFQINPSDEQGPPLASEMPSGETFEEVENPVSEEVIANSHSMSAFAPSSLLCRNLMAAFFNYQYQYHMCLYREYFLRDFDAGAGPYYSDLLLYAICALGALASEEIAPRELSDIFFNRAQQLLYGSALESPNLTTLQALILLGHREIGHGKTSKGWLFSGMAFRLAHEMGLHLDPNNWNGSDDSRVEREILRRTYWAAFIADKQLSLYFGRPPALYPGHSDVHATLRIPYPPEWEALLNTYIQKGTSETAYEDGMALVAAFIQQAELSKILHRMITEVFENRNVDAEETVLATSVMDIHVALTKWSADLPAKLHWNQWSVGPIPSLVLHLHMLYHASMIILHRPPRNMFKDPKIATSQDVKTCYESLEAIIKLLRIYSKHYQFSHLPFTFVHILASAASGVLMKRYIENSSWTEITIAKPLALITDSLSAVAQTWPCAKQVQGVINSAMKHSPQDNPRNESPQSFDLMTSFMSQDGMPSEFGEYEMGEVGDMELYDFTDVPFQWSDGSF